MRDPSTLRRCVLIASIAGALWIGAAAQVPTPAQSLPTTPAALFQIDRVYTVHLTLAARDWASLRPRPSRPESPRVDGFRGPEGKRNGLSAIRGLDFEYVHATLEIDGRRFDDVGVRHKGNGTYRAGLDTGKLSFKVDLNKYVKGQKIAGLTTLNLHNNITDASFMNEVLAYRLYRDAKVPAPRTAYARVFVTVPGTHSRAPLGLYSLVENVDDNFARAAFGIDGGAIFKPVTQTLFRDLGPDWAPYQQPYDPKADVTAADRQRVIDISALVTNATDTVFAQRLPEFVDLDAFARYMAVLVWIANPDSVLQQGQNYFTYLHPKTRTFTFIPWDQDHSFGQFMWTSETQQQRLSILRPWTVTSRMLERTFQLPAFRQKYLASLDEITRTLTAPERLARQVDELAGVLGPVVAAEPVAERRESFRRAVAGQKIERPYYGGMAASIKAFVPLRQASVLEQLRAAQR